MKKIILIKLFILGFWINSFSQLCIYLTSFTAQKSGCNVNLQFATDCQSSSLLRIMVQRSTDGINFYEIAQFCTGGTCDAVPPPIASGTIYPGTTVARTYNYTDPNPFSLGLASDLYYRIRFVGGSFTYSSIEHISATSLSGCTYADPGLCNGVINGPSSVQLCGDATGTYTVTGAIAQTINWSSSNTAVATMSGNILTPVSTGTTTVSAYLTACNKTITKSVSVVACADTCKNIKIYNTGTVPSGTSKYGYIYGGSSAGTGGSGTVIVSAAATTYFNAVQEVNLYDDFDALVTGSGEFNAQIVGCNGAAARPVKTVDKEESKPEVLSPRFTVYPNPAKEMVLLNLANIKRGNTNIEVRDVNGKVVLKNKLNIATDGSYMTPLYTGRLVNGVYLITVTSNNYSKTSKIVIAK